MPGLLKRSHDQIDGPADDEATDAPDRKRVALDYVNGEAAVTGPANGLHPTPTFSDVGLQQDLKLSLEAQKLAEKEEPPELHHVTEGYVPLGLLISRLAQETHNDLELLIAELAEIQTNQMNGYGSAQSAQVNVRKKERLFSMAHNYRTKFIKLLVLSQWSHDSQAVSKLIDLNNWIMFKKEEYRNAVAWMGELKRMLAPMQIPAPDLRTALEVLSTGKSSWISDMGYVPPEALSSREMLKALRTINTLLRIRLNLHEDIPDEMMDFNIRSGRATFRVKDEFEIDLSIADEDHSSQLYFIDFRFSFSPCTAEVPEGPLRSYLEAKTNAILKSEGLRGCHSFLHDFVLTHKLNILRRQALDMARSLWSDSIRVEQVHRGLVVQYWKNRPGAKNWIEIGIRKRRRKPGEVHESDASHLGVRWHSHGREVLDHEVKIEAAELSLERILKDFIARHTNMIFRQTKHELKQGEAYRKGLLFIKHRAHPTEPAESCLKMQTTLQKSIKITQDPISGFFSIAPTSAMHYQIEFQLNRLKHPASEASLRLALLRCDETLAQIDTRARMRRWLNVQTYRPNPETIKRLFHAERVRMAFYMPPDWGKDWLLAATASLDGDKWWVVEVQGAPRNPSPMDYVTEAYQPLKRSLRVNIAHNAALVFDPSYQALSLIERSAAALLSQYTDVRELARLKVEYKQAPARNSTAAIVAPDLYIHMPLPTSTHVQSKNQWCGDIVRSTFAGISKKERVAITVVTGRLTEHIPHIERFAKSMDSSLAFHPVNGQFAFRLKTRIGQPSVTELGRRFDRISTLVQFINVTSSKNLQCNRISLDSLSFNYAQLDCDPAGTDPDILNATINFPPDKPPTLSLLEGNPHLRVADSLNQMLNDPKNGGLLQVIEHFRIALSLLRGFTQLERDISGPQRVIVTAHSAQFFVVRYTSLRAGFVYRLKLRYRPSDSAVAIWMDGFEPKPAVQSLMPWSSGDKPNAEAEPDTEKSSTAATTDTTSSDAKKALPPSKNKSSSQPKRSPSLSETDKARNAILRTAWDTLCKEKHKSHWMGVRGGIFAEVHAARACLLHIDEIMRPALAEADALDPRSSNTATTEGASSSAKAAADKDKNSKAKDDTAASSFSSSSSSTANKGATAFAAAKPVPTTTPATAPTAGRMPPGAVNGAMPAQMTPTQHAAMEATRMKARPAQMASNRGRTDIITLDD